MAVKQTIVHPDHPMISVKLKNEEARVHNPSSGRRLVFGEITQVPDAPYWRRRIRDGHVELVENFDTATGKEIDHNGGNPQLDGEPVNPSRVGPPKAGPPSDREPGTGPVTTTTKKTGEKG
jgi:hypothetical protein